MARVSTYRTGLAVVLASGSLLATGVATAGANTHSPSDWRVGPQIRGQSVSDLTRSTSARLRNRLMITLSSSTSAAGDILRAVQDRVRPVLEQTQSSTNRLYADVSPRGRILSQSGGITVDHPATGVYTFAWRTGPTGCSMVAYGSSRLIHAGGFTIVVPKPGMLEVERHVNGVLTDGGFILDASC